MRISVSEVSIGAAERNLLEEVLSSGHLVQGRLVEKLEAEFARLAGARHVVATSSGTTALQLALEIAGVGPGDEVVTSPFTFVATLNAVLTRGAVARLVDIDPATFNLRPDLVEAAVSHRTRVLLPVHLYGLPADMDSIGRIAREHRLRIVEDAAQAHFASQGGYPVGTMDLGCFSLYATKNLAAGEGGLITVRTEADAQRLRILRNQGMGARYEYIAVGYNYRLTDLAAAVALGGLGRMAEIMAIRKRNAAFLTQALQDLPGIITPQAQPGYEHVWHQYTLRVTKDSPLNRDQLASALNSRGIGSGIYYPKVLVDYPVFSQHPNIQYGDLEVARMVAGEVISIPVHQGLDVSDLEQISGAVRACLSGA